MPIYVEGFNGNALGDASSFGEAKRMQIATVPDALKPYYGGIGQHGQVLFYEIPDALRAEFPQLQDRH